MSQILKILDLY